jgi:hypothetical protein
MLISKFGFVKSMPVKKIPQIDLTISQMTESEPPQLHESQKIYKFYSKMAKINLEGLLFSRKHVR